MAEIVAKAALGQHIDVLEIIKAMGGTAYELANAICDPPQTLLALE